MFALKELAVDIIPKEELSKVYNCKDCDLGGWLSETEVELHCRKSHKKEYDQLLTKENVCLPCRKQLEDDEAVLSHIKTEHFYSSGSSPRIEREIFICDYCHSVYFNKDLLAIHIVYRHQKIITMKPLKCPVCPKELKPRLAYGHMVNRHQVQSVTLCPVCLSKRPNRNELAAHMATHWRHYHCSICGFMGTRERDFILHLEKYKSRPVTEVTKFAHCFHPPEKWRRFKSKFSYMRIRPVIMGLVIPEHLCVCVLCRQICKREGDEMKMHIARDHSTQELEDKVKYKCSCGEEFSNSILLKYHVFKLKGDHRALSKDKIPEPPNEPEAESNGVTEKEDERPTEDTPTSYIFEDFVVDVSGVECPPETNNFIEMANSVAQEKI